MESKKFTAGFIGIAKSVFIRSITITFILSVVMVGVAGEIDAVGALLWVSVIGAIIWDFLHLVTIEVRTDGVNVTKSGQTPVFYSFDKYDIKLSGSYLTMSPKRSGKTENIKCACFTKSGLGELSAYIKKRGQVWRFNTTPEPVQTTIDDQKKAADLKQAAKKAAMSSAEANSRNPYAKKAVPAATQKAEEITEKIKVEEPPKITEVPTTADLPETSELDKFLSEKPKESAHDHGEDFHKAVFYYPRRDIEDRTERKTTLSVLTTLALGVLTFLLAYIVFPRLVLPEAGAVVIVCVIVIASLVGSRSAKLRGMPSKLEVTANHFVVDNTRYRVNEMSHKSMTSPDMKIGNRRVSFTYSGKQIICQLGPCTKDNKNSDEYFSRYDELCDKLREKGFRCS